MIWFVSTASRGLVLAPSIVAVRLASQYNVPIGITALASLLFVTGLAQFIADHDGIGRKSSNKAATTHVAVYALGLLIPWLLAGGWLVAGVLVVPTALVIAEVARRRSLLIDNGRIVRPYLAVGFRNLTLAGCWSTVFLIDHPSSRVIGSLVAGGLAASAVVDYLVLANKEGTPTGAEKNRSSAGMALLLGMGLLLSLPVAIRLVLEGQYGIEVLFEYEYFDRWAYLLLSALIGGLGAEIQRMSSRASNSPRPRVLVLTVVMTALTGMMVSGGLAVSPLRPFDEPDLALALISGFTVGLATANTLVARWRMGQAELSAELLVIMQLGALTSITGAGIAALLGAPASVAVGCIAMFYLVLSFALSRETLYGLRGAG